MGRVTSAPPLEMKTCCTAGKAMPTQDTVGTPNSKSATPKILSSPFSSGPRRIWTRRMSNDWSPVGRIVCTRENSVLTTTDSAPFSNLSGASAGRKISGASRPERAACPRRLASRLASPPNAPSGERHPAREGSPWLAARGPGRHDGAAAVTLPRSKGAADVQAGLLPRPLVGSERDSPRIRARRVGPAAPK
jgi:hypothetical protein